MSKISLSFFLSSLLIFFHFSLSLLFLRSFESCLLRGWKTELVSPFRSLPFRLRIRLTRNNLSLSLSSTFPSEHLLPGLESSPFLRASTVTQFREVTLML